MSPSPSRLRPPRRRGRSRIAMVIAGTAVAGSVLAAIPGVSSARPFCPDGLRSGGPCGPDDPDDPGPDPPPPPPPPPTPPARLRDVYVGALTGDFGSRGSVVLRLSGDPSSVSLDAEVAAGVHADCHGDHDVGPMRFSMSGARSYATSNGYSLYRLGQQVTTTYAGWPVTVTFDTDAGLSADGLTLSGPVRIHAQLPWWAGNCDLGWRFDTKAL